MTPNRRTFESYPNAVFAKFMWDSFAIFSWTILPSAFYFSSLATVLCGFLCGVQMVGSVCEIGRIGGDWQKNPFTGEWSKME